MTAEIRQRNMVNYPIYITSKIIFNLNVEQKVKISNLKKKLLIPKFEFKNRNICFVIDDEYISIGKRKENNTIEINQIYVHIRTPKDENDNNFYIGNVKYNKLAYPILFSELSDFAINQIIYLSETKFVFLFSYSYISFIELPDFNSINIIDNSDNIQMLYKL